MANTFDNIETTAYDMVDAREELRQVINSYLDEYLYKDFNGIEHRVQAASYLSYNAPLSYFSNSIDCIKTYTQQELDWSRIGIYDDIEMFWEGITYGAEIKNILDNTITTQNTNINSIFHQDVANYAYDFPLEFGYSSYDFIFVPNVQGFKNVTTASHAFQYCPKTTYIGVLDFGKATNLTYLFGENWSLRNIDTVYAPLSSLPLSFINCRMLTEINNLTTAGESHPYTFSFCDNLVRINNYDFSLVTATSDRGIGGAEYIRYMALDGLGTKSNATSFNFSMQAYWGVNTTYIPDAFDSLVYTFDHAFNRQDYGYSSITVQVSNNTYNLLVNNTDIIISGISNNAGGDLISQISLKGITIGH